MLLQELLSELYGSVPAERFIPKTEGFCTAAGQTQKVSVVLPYAHCGRPVLPPLLPQGEKTSLCGTDIQCDLLARLNFSVAALSERQYVCH